MKTKTPVSTRQKSVTVRDLKTRKNPKGGFTATINWGDGSTPTGVLAARAQPFSKS